MEKSSAAQLSDYHITTATREKLFLTLSLYQYVDRKTTTGYNKIKRAEVTYE